MAVISTYDQLKAAFPGLTPNATVGTYVSYAKALITQTNQLLIDAQAQVASAVALGLPASSLTAFNQAVANYQQQVNLLQIQLNGLSGYDVNLTVSSLMDSGTPTTPVPPPPTSPPPDTDTSVVDLRSFGDAQLWIDPSFFKVQTSSTGASTNAPLIVTSPIFTTQPGGTWVSKDQPALSGNSSVQTPEQLVAKMSVGYMVAMGTAIASINQYSDLAGKLAAVRDLASRWSGSPDPLKDSAFDKANEAVGLFGFLSESVNTIFNHVTKGADMVLAGNATSADVDAYWNGIQQIGTDIQKKALIEVAGTFGGSLVSTVLSFVFMRQEVGSFTFVTQPEASQVNGSAHNDTLAYSGSLGMRVNLGAGNDIASLGAGNDTLTGGAGNDILNGGAGIDTAIFTGVRSNFTVTKNSSGYTIADRSGSQGTDTLASVERLKFADTSIALDISGNAGMAYRLYQAAFNRTPDAGGLGFQMKALDDGLNIAQVGQNFINSPEFSTTYGSLNDTQFVTQLYQNVLHRAADAGGLAYHTGNLASGANTRANVLVGFSESPENQAALIGTIQNGIVYTV